MDGRQPMCELLLRVTNSALRGDPLFDSKASRRGDVIVVVPDGWAWGAKELTNPFWRIVKLPNVSLSVGEMLVAEEPQVGPEPVRTRQFRWYNLVMNHAELPAAFRTWLADDTRAQPTITVTRIKFAKDIGSDIVLTDVFVKKAPIPDPAL